MNESKLIINENCLLKINLNSIKICIKEFIKNNVEARAGWDLLSETKMYKNCPKMKLGNSKRIISKIINIPSRKI